MPRTGMLGSKACSSVVKGFVKVSLFDDQQNFIKERAEAFKERRDFVVKELNNIKGLSCLNPNGAFYVFPNCKKLLGKKTKLKTDTNFVEKLLEKIEEDDDVQNVFHTMEE